MRLSLLTFLSTEFHLFVCIYEPLRYDRQGLVYSEMALHYILHKRIQPSRPGLFDRTIHLTAILTRNV